ncbi:hypothetical protein [Bosea sp. ANAM02]|uniref:hypothetical protein n=1 Tax=Bosea sp. ANAM02 TaxID=2020412 RepID=UPI00140F2426|nr:hypothetical protein [Bosea sp. ANAM02]BCB19679.1 type I secretion system ATPase [Bosea sp. ANAM02]
MQAGGITETIWHFIGYLHLADTVARAPVFYDGDPPPALPLDAPDFMREPLRGLAFDELVSLPTASPQPLAAHPQSSLGQALSPAGFGLPGRALPSLPPPLKPVPFQVEEHGIGLRAPSRVISVEYKDGGVENLIQIRQANVASDRDLITSDDIRYADGSVVVPEEWQLADRFAALIGEANDVVPDGIPDMTTALQFGTESVVAMVSGRDAAWAETGSPYPDGRATGTAPEGRIVDGVANAPDPYAPTSLDIAPWRPQETPDDAPVEHAVEAKLDLAAPTGGVATIAETGLNAQVNAAVIVDANEAVGSMMVGGDYFYSRGIVQVNILVDNDHVDIAVAGDLSPLAKTAGNEVHNIAEFITHESTISVRGATGTPHWVVDVMSGDFYDVKSIVQFNGLDDNDRTVQAEGGTYFNLGTGSNLQINLAKVFGVDSYDIIIIGGNYHRADWIYQYNIMLDPDSAKLFSTGGDGSETTVTTGLNSLTNKATIETYDAPAFKPMLGAHHDLMDLLADGATILIPDADWQLYGSASGTLNILYVSGDYYDVNVITQVNFLIDGDQSIQASAKEGTEQGVAAGGNSALNEAVIVDPGLLSTSNYLGGDAYEEAVLIQTNIVTDSDTVTIHDTTTLVPELVAFAQNAAQEPEPDCPPVQTVDPQQDHLTSSIMV